MSATVILVEARPNARSSLDFVHDQFDCGRRFRILNVVDDETRECLAAIPDTSISGRRVARELTTLIEQRGKPGMIVSDNGAEFTSNAMLACALDVADGRRAIGRAGYDEASRIPVAVVARAPLPRWCLRARCAVHPRVP
jgi:transposase InsO family protein